MSRVSVASETDVVEAVREARATRTPLEIISAGSKRALGRPIPSTLAALDASCLSGIVAYEPEELIITVLPGTPVVDIEAALAAKGQRLGFEPPDWGPLLGSPTGIGTIGGAISTDASGPARVRYGAVRDQLLGIRAVNGFGEAFKAGGKVVKNVTGFDIPKLVCGSFGMLCVLTEVTLRVFPRPTCKQTFAVRDLEVPEGFALLRKVWASPLEATALSFSRGTAFIRLEGEAKPLTEKAGLLKSICGGRDAQPVDDRVIRSIGDGHAFLDAADPVWRLSLPPSQAAAAIEQVQPTLWVGDCAGGVVWLATNKHQLVRSVVQTLKGHATLIRADDPARALVDVFDAEDAVRAQLTRSVKAAFDPFGLFNPGRMWDGV